MVSIIRSPAISDQKRKLSTRRARVEDGEAAAPVAVDPALPTPAASASAQRAVEVATLVEQARQAVLAQFKDEAEKSRELGRERGLREGRLTGAEEARQSFSAEFARVRSLADQLEKTVETGIHGIEDIAVAIAFEALCKVLGEAAVTREGLQALVRQAASHAINSERVVVRLHAADFALLSGADALNAHLGSGAAVSWVADHGVALGGCVVETDGGTLDARLETQLERLRAALLAARLNAPVAQ